ncbi:glycosyltransferase family 4 protein [Nitratidesulfovibrio sp. 1201_IL3209]|uniref:glycosyltransferase family 4 protein n=1 Tax=Nitratidesulfovibrio sp. 1201_IL3209 TaxID=3084053 RepID=UPI002FDA2F6A
MRLVIAKKLRFPHAAANHIQAVNMASAFAACGVETEIYPAMRRGTGQTLAEHLSDDYAVDLPPALRLRTIPFRGPTLYDAFFHARLASALRIPNAVFLAREPKPAAALLRMASIFGKKIRLFLELHDITHDELLCHVLQHPCGIVCVHSEILHTVRKKFGYNGPAFVAPAGYNPNVFHSASTDINRRQHFTIGYFGSITPAKGVGHLLDMMLHLPETFRLALIGGVTWPDMNDFRRRVECVPLWQERIILTGRVAPSHVGETLAGVDASIVPASSDASFYSQIKITESLGCGLPIILPPVRSTTEALIPGTHCVVSAGLSGQHLAAAVLELATGPDAPARLAAMREANAALAPDFTWQARARGILDFMHDTMRTPAHICPARTFHCAGPSPAQPPQAKQ